MTEGGYSLAINFNQIHHANLTPSKEELAELMKQATVKQKARAAAEDADESDAELN
jgi:hypothetical protein